MSGTMAKVRLPGHTAVLRKSTLFAQSDKTVHRKEYEFEASIENELLARVKAGSSVLLAFKNR